MYISGQVLKVLITVAYPKEHTGYILKPRLKCHVYFKNDFSLMVLVDLHKIKDGLNISLQLIFGDTIKMPGPINKGLDTSIIRNEVRHLI